MAVIISRRQEGKDAGLSLTTEWLCSLSPATDSTGQDWGDGDDQQPPGKAAGEDEGQQDGPASPAVGDGPSAWVLLQGPCPEILTLCILTQSSSSTVLNLVIKQSPLYFIIYENEAGLIVMNLDFVCSSLLVWELVCFTFNFQHPRITFSHHLPPADSLTGHVGNCGVGQVDGRSECWDTCWRPQNKVPSPRCDSSFRDWVAKIPTLLPEHLYFSEEVFRGGCLCFDQIYVWRKKVFFCKIFKFI